MARKKAPPKNCHDQPYPRGYPKLSSVTGSPHGYATTIAGGKVTVPSNCWKVVVALPVGTNDVARITTSTRVIAINTPNTTSIGTSWGAYRTRVDAIESATGLDLLSALSTSLQNTLEAKTDTGATN